MNNETVLISSLQDIEKALEIVTCEDMIKYYEKRKANIQDKLKAINSHKELLENE